jgi:hypothetical protein
VKRFTLLRKKNANSFSRELFTVRDTVKIITSLFLCQDTFSGFQDFLKVAFAPTWERFATAKLHSRLSSLARCAAIPALPLALILSATGQQI